MISRHQPPCDSIISLHEVEGLVKDSLGGLLTVPNITRHKNMTDMSGHREIANRVDHFETRIGQACRQFCLKCPERCSDLPVGRVNELESHDDGIRYSQYRCRLKFD